MNRKYPMTLIFLMVISLMAPLIGTSNLSEDLSVNETQARSTACVGDICINEVLVNAFGSETGAVGPSDWTSGEWVEIYNSGTSTVDLSTWTLQDHSSRALTMSTANVVYPTSAVDLQLSAGDYMVLARNGDGGSCGFCLKNTNGQVELVNPIGTTVHTITWTTRPTEGVSLIEDSNNPTADWVESSTLSPGDVNTGGTPTGPIYFPGDIVINEVMADAYPSFDNATYPDGEWIEILNIGTDNINLSGWNIKDAAGNTLDFDADHLVGYSSSESSWFIAGGDTRIIAVNGSANSGVLNNGVEKLRVHWPNGTISDEVNWTTNEPGFSLSRISNTDSMYISPFPTANDTNLAQIENLPIQTSDIILTEYLPATNTTSTTFPDGKWIEVLNNGTNQIDLQGWSVTNGRGDVLYLDPGSMVFNQSHTSSTIIESGQRRIVQFPANFDLYDYYEHVILKNNNGDIVDTAWHTNYFGENVSMIKDSNSFNGAWVPSMWLTPGEPEPGNEPYSFRDLKFTEILPDPLGLDSQSWPLGEWVEVYNNDTVAVDLAGWKLKASSSRSFTLGDYNFPLQNDAIIQPGEVGLIALNGTNSFYFKQSTDIITLVDSTEAIVDVIGWNTSNENVSLIPPGTSHSGYTTTSPDGLSGWVEPAWATPGLMNPVWPQYSGENSLVMTEYMGWCEDSGTIYNDWIEVFNSGNAPLDLSRWRIDTPTNRHYATNLATVDTNDENNIIQLATPTTILQPGDYGLISLDDPFLWANDVISLFNPDGLLISQSLPHGQGLSPIKCKSWISQDGENWTSAAYPTPGEENIDLDLFATADDLLLVRVSPYGDDEFIQIVNTGDETAYLNEWTISINDGTISECIIDMPTLFLMPDQTMTIYSGFNPTDFNQYTAEVTNFANYAPNVASYSEVGCSDFYIPDSGSAIGLKDYFGNLADVMVFDNGAAEQAGWNSQTVSVPTNNLIDDDFVFIRGNGCDIIPDTNSTEDWQHQWSLIGMYSTVCLQTIVSETSSQIVPIVGPQNGLLELIDWIDGAQTSIKVQLYQMQEPQLVKALTEALERGVDVEVMLDPGCNNCNIWSQNDLQYKNDYARLLIDSGATVYEFNPDSNEPYLYLHSKVSIRDSNSVWMSSGNWKPSSTPAPGVRGNVEWSIIVDNSEVAEIVEQQFELDKMFSQRMYASDYQEYSFLPPTSIGGGGLQTSVVSDISSEIITCPENCVTKIVQFINSAESEILLSQQTLDVDWSYGWGDENPIITALHDAAQNGVSVRLIINGAYLDDDDQEVVDLFNEVWNGTENLDASAIVMSEDDDVAKLHNKGIIVDQKSVLISSINMGSSAMNKNREMGIIIHSSQITQYYLDGWRADWNRLDNVTDSDQDTLTDKWEVMNGLNRTKKTLASGITEDKYDADGDGVNNTDEYKQGSNPLLADTDGDCADDSVEIAWAQSTALVEGKTTVAILDALTLTDADGDGITDTEQYGCDLSVEPVIQEPDNNQTYDPDADDDGDGIINADDECPNTEAGGLTDQKGCSSEQLNELADASDGEKDQTGPNTMLIVMIVAAIFTAGAFLVLKNLESKANAAKDLVSLDEQNLMIAENSAEVATEEWTAPVLDGSTQNTDSGISAEDVAKFPGWTEEIIQRYLDSGWTLEQLSQYYQEQIENNQ